MYGLSICTRSVQMDLRRSQVLQPFPTHGSGTLWVAGESLVDRRVSCLPPCTVCPTRSPSLDTNRSTCRGGCSWSGRLVTPPGRCHLGPLTNGPGRIRPYFVRSGRADTVTRGASKPLAWGFSPASPVGSFRPAPPPRAVLASVVGLSPLLAWVQWWCWGGGPLPLLAEVLVCASPPLLAGARCQWWWLVPRHSWLGSAGSAGGVVLRHSWPGSAGLGGVARWGSPPLLARVR